MSMYGDSREDMNYIYQLLLKMADERGKAQAVKSMLNILEDFMIYEMDAE